jgi:hypothetical protein
VDRNTLRRVALAVLAVLALGVTAATIDSAVVSEGGRLGVGQTPTGGVGSGDAAGFGADRSRAAARLALPSPCFPVLNDPRFLGGAAVVALGGLYLIYRDTESLLPPLALGLAFGIPLFIVHQLLTACTDPPVEPRFAFGLGSAGNATFPIPEGAGGAAGAAVARTVSTPSLLLGFLLILAILGSFVLLLGATGDETEPEAPESPADPEVDVAAVGRAAGAAADRIEDDADVDNEVYRAWTEMTAHLDVSNPRSSTPSEFAAAAVDAGMARGDVEELTALFEEVRYGGAEPTPERERRAVDALRRIESAYAGEEP